MVGIVRLGSVALLGLVCSVGCSGSDNPNDRPGAGAGAGAVTGGMGAAGAAGSFQNPDGGVVAAQGGAGGAGAAGGAGGSSGGGGLQPVNLDECPGSLDQGTVDSLMAATGNTVSPMRWLYPYDATVYPRGLASPLLQWDEPASGASTAVLLKMSSQLFTYQGCLAPTGPGRLQIPQGVWDMAGAQSRGSADPLSIEVTTLSGGQPSSLPARSLVFALATLKNSIYYNTYNSPLAASQGAATGVIMRITPGQPDPEVFATAGNALNCVGCHAVSADGSRMVAEEHVQPGLAEATSSVFDLSNVTSLPAAPAVTGLTRAGFSALYPDGSVYLTTGRPQAGPFGGAGNITGTFGPEDSRLIDASDGADIPNSGAPKYALMPMFSTDGQKVVFNLLNDDGSGGQTLAVMDFDRATNKFTNLQTIYTAPAGKWVGWPFFMPSVQREQEINTSGGRKVIFALGAQGDYVTQEAPAAITVHQSELWWVDLDTGMSSRLGEADGISGGTNYLPYGARDADRDFIPTVSPVAAGGYFWLFFTSRRNYGNEQVLDLDNLAETKKIWVSAIDIDATPGQDVSHPAFYLPGQELESGNLRAFAALDPCRGDGESCESGIDCCSGYCLNGVCGVPDIPRCSELDEVCETTADCCDGDGTVCIGGFCGYVVPE